ncbi:MAG TPA: AAA family ATPase, partial [Ktedonobacterales bacterium]|nr:AAA family ATPase [Ktedonobacterales bacterium]
MASPHALNFAAQLKRLRRAAGLSQEELAHRANFSVSYIGQLERGLHMPVRATAEILAQALELDAAGRAALLGALPVRRETPRLPSPIEVPPPAPLVGRAGELERIAGHLAGDGPPLLVLTGEPGIGKTRLLRAALERATADGLPALLGGCHRRSGQEPYEPLLGALLGYLRQISPARQRLDLRRSSWLVRLVPELAEATVVPLPQWILPPEQERRLMFAAVRQFLANVAGTCRVLLVLDDLQWAGMDALDLLGALLRPAPEPGLRVLAAVRATEMRADAPLALLLADLEREGLAARAPLGTLSAAESAALLDHLLAQDAATRAPAPDDAVARQRMLERSDGVPLYLVSCAKGWRDAVAPAGTPDIPDTISQSIQQRVLALPQVTRQVLEVAALVGRVAPRALLAAALEPLGFASEHLVLALETASAAGLLVEDGPAAHAFAHDLIREALLAQMSAARRQALHWRIALALEHLHAANLDAASGQIALHHAHGDEPSNAIPFLERAG